MVRVKNKTPGSLHITWLNIVLKKDEEIILEDNAVENYVTLLETLAAKNYIEFERISETQQIPETGTDNPEPLAPTAEVEQVENVVEQVAEQEVQEQATEQSEAKKKKKK